MKLSNYITGVRIASSANPNGVTLKHNGGFDPSHKAVFKDGQYIIPVVNTMRKARTPDQEAGVIIEMASKKLKEAKNG